MQGGGVDADSNDEQPGSFEFPDPPDRWIPRICVRPPPVGVVIFMVQPKVLIDKFKRLKECWLNESFALLPVQLFKAFQISVVMNSDLIYTPRCFES